MTLKEYLDKYKINHLQFAAKCGITCMGSFYLYLYKGVRPSQKRAERIEQESDYLVSVVELRGKDDRIIAAENKRRRELRRLKPHQSKIKQNTF